MKLPFFKELESAQTVLLAGAGGGFDIFCGLPLYFWLRKAGKTVHLANLSFTQLGFCDGDRPVPSLVRVQPDTGGSQNCFPEVHLSHWLTKRFGHWRYYNLRGVIHVYREIPRHTPEDQTVEKNSVLRI